MTVATARKSTPPELSVEQVAEIIRRMDRHQRRQLLRLVPELQETPPEPSTDDDLKAWAEAKLAEARRQGARPMRDDDAFIGGLTVREYLDLSDEEDDALWEQLYAEARKELGQREYPVREDAVPARQERSA